MTNLNNRLIAGILVFFSLVFLANSTNPPNGRTGGPGDSACSAGGCHVSSNPNLDGEITITGLPPSITANTNYTITVTVDNPNGNGVRAGFQWVALDASNLNVGTMSNPSANTTTTLAGGRTYHEHQPAQGFGAGNSVSHTVEWTAPNGPNGETITFWGAGVIGNGANGNSGDRVRFTSVSGTLSGGLTPPTATITVNNHVTCNGFSDGSATVVAMGGSPGYTYLWDNGETGMTALNLNAGIHTVVVTDMAMASVTVGVTITEPNPIVIGLITLQDEDCTAQNGLIEVGATGGSGSLFYSWSDGSSGSTITNLSAGDYTVFVSDLSNCSESVTYTVGNNSGNVSISLVNSIDPTCVGDANGSIQVIGAGGTSPYNYAWSDGHDMALNPNLTSGDYSVTVTDSLGCEHSETYTLGSPNPISIVETNNMPENCIAEDGSSMIQASGGSGNYSYSWSNGASGPTLVGVSAGVYQVVVTDDNMCSDSLLVSINNDPGNLGLTLNAMNDVSCFGLQDGSISVTANGGMMPYEFIWSSGDSTMQVSNLAAGTYDLTITDAFGCSITEDFTLIQPQEILANPTIEGISCFGETDGAISLNPSAGMGPLSYQWSNGSTSQNIDSLAAGYYHLTITDSTNCFMLFDSLQIIEPDSFFLNPEIIVLPGCNGQTFGTIAANPIGGTGPYNYSWSIGFMTDTINVTPGFYPVTVTDANDCVATDFINLTITDETPPTINAMDFTLYVDDVGQTSMIDTSMFDLGSTDDCQLDGFIFDPSALDCSQDSFLYPIALEDMSGNISYDTLTVTIIDTFPPEIFCLEDFSTTDCGPITFDLPLAFDNCGVTVSQISGPLSGDALEVGVNEIVFEAIDNQGNIDQCTLSITLVNSITYELTVMDVSCFNFQDGSVQITADSDNPPLTTNFIDFVDPNFLEAGVYHFEIIDATGCAIIDSFEIDEPPVLLIDDFMITNSTTSNSMDGAIEITVAGGDPGYMYQWYFNGAPFSNDEDISGLAPGEYTVDVTDMNDCIFSSIVYVVEATTSTLDLELYNSINAFPNPASEVLNIEFEGSNSAPLQYEMLDITGKAVFNIQSPKHKETISLTTLEKGIYLLKVDFESQRFFKKVIVQ